MNREKKKIGNSNAKAEKLCGSQKRDTRRFQWCIFMVGHADQTQSEQQQKREANNIVEAANDDAMKRETYETKSF